MKKVFNTLNCLILACASSYSSLVESKLIFFESFDNKPDWTSLSEETYPGWTTHLNSASNWDISTEHSSHSPNIEILPSTNGIHYGDRGGAMLNWRESFSSGHNTWNSDGILLLNLGGGHNELYVTFQLAFSPEWTSGGHSKIFRAYSWDTSSSEYFKYFSYGNAGPMMLWGYTHNEYGVRNFVSLRGGPFGENYKISNEDITGLPRELVGNGDLSLNFTDNPIDKFPCTDPGSVATHDQVYNKYPIWNKVEFYLKLNSKIGANDGVFKQWINGKLVADIQTIPWVKSNENNVFPSWNVIALGGNDNFHDQANELKHEEWYAIDELFVYDSLPKHKQ